METYVKADLFFFITSIAVIAVTALLMIALYYGIKILRNIRYISDKAKTEADQLSADIKDLRESVKKEGVRARGVLDFLGKFYRRQKNK